MDRDQDQRQLFGYGFVEIGSVEKAEEMMTALNGVQLERLKGDVFSAQ